MIDDVSIMGRIQKFDGSIWQAMEIDTEIVEPIGESGGYGYALLDGVPIRYVVDSEHASVSVIKEELLFA